MNYILDFVDLDILHALQEDARLSVRQLATRVHRSPTPVFERLRRLENEGVVKGYTVVLDQDKVGRGFTVFCNVKLSRISTDIHTDFASAIQKMPEVAECYNTSGQYDYLLKIQVPDMKSYRTFVTDRLGRLPMLDSVQSIFVMEELKNTPVHV